ncbi:hypothetical protein GCM10023340_17740 [Nocardioides marinquilinus]|uniref:DUF3152 domain-containing protein n=1 Tax=Nocardioides marinquilinus TaxID=1210400 RepID=A0ABP9PHA2_9ACTN
MLRAGRGRWTPSDVTVTYAWLRDGEPVRGARDRGYLLQPGDVGRRMTVRVRATDADGHHGWATSAPTAPVAKAQLRNLAAPTVSGVARYPRVLTAQTGRWSTRPARFTYQWLRDGRPVPGATLRYHEVLPRDVGSRVAVVVTAYSPGHEPATARSAPVTAKHRVDVRRTVTYSVTTRGKVTANLRAFRAQAQATYDDARGWRGKGVRFRPVRRGGDFTLVLAEARTMTSFSSQCSVMWSCRVGRFVVINQTRWRSASPAWNRARESRRDYRHMVVNHETGHWLGYGHASCPGRGDLAPVMMQQSKGTQGCRLNPWPTTRELRR